MAIAFVTQASGTAATSTTLALTITASYQPTWTLSAAGTSGAATAALNAAVAAASSGLPDLVMPYQL